MNTAIIIAGGVGNRTGQSIPKQFINVLDKPIIAYTLERFQKHPLIDEIGVVCLEGWEEILKAYALQFGIAKLKWIVPGGDSSFTSIYNGLKAVEASAYGDDIVIIHDGIRPMVDEEILTSCIEICKEKGNGISALPVYEQIFKIHDSESTNEYIPRDELKILQTPQAYHFREIFDAYTKYKEDNMYSAAYANTLMVDMGKTLFFSKGSTKNIKITTKEDIEIFKAMLQSER